jgi:hypothetical protein
MEKAVRATGVAMLERVLSRLGLRRRPAEGAPSPGFEADIRPLFREADRDFMTYMFDLWLYDDVREHAEAIYERTADGTMPCDAPWEPSRLVLFRAWIDTGCAP